MQLVLDSDELAANDAGERRSFLILSDASNISLSTEAIVACSSADSSTLRERTSRLMSASSPLKSASCSLYCSKRYYKLLRVFQIEM